MKRRKNVNIKKVKKNINAKKWEYYFGQAWAG
jgi:hypothetical protein